MEICFGNNIKHLRQINDLTQEQLGEKLGKSKETINGYERSRSFPQFEVLLKLSQLFEVNLDDLVFIDLSKTTSQPYRTDQLDVNLLNEMLLKRVRQLESEFKKIDPERAKRLGIE